MPQGTVVTSQTMQHTDSLGVRTVHLCGLNSELRVALNSTRMAPI